MAINFSASQDKQKYLIILFALIVLVSIFILRKDSSNIGNETGMPEAESFQFDKSKIDVNFGQLADPNFQNLFPFEVTMVYPEAQNISLSPVFSWQSMQGAENYVFEIVGFWESTVSETSVNLASSNKTLKPSTSYVWRVKACNKDLTNCGAWSNNCKTGKELECARFSTIKGADFSLSFPQNEAQNISLSPVFSWQSMQGAENYVFEIVGFWESTVSETSVNLASSNKTLKPSTSYVWRVKACNKDLTNCGAWRSSSFVTAASLSKPELISPVAENKIILGRDNPFEQY